MNTNVVRQKQISSSIKLIQSNDNEFYTFIVKFLNKHTNFIYNNKRNSMYLQLPTLTQLNMSRQHNLRHSHAKLYLFACTGSYEVYM